jgi:DNA mismatch repair protein MutH
MTDPNPNPQGYRRPPLTRGVDPQRMNWLWRLICEVAALQPAEVAEALHGAQVPVDLQRVRGWVASDTEEHFFPLTIAELERNLRALAMLRATQHKVAAALAQVAQRRDPPGG